MIICYHNMIICNWYYIDTKDDINILSLLALPVAAMTPHLCHTLCFERINTFIEQID